MIAWFVAALCALVALWALSRASYWKWMWQGERSLNQALMGRPHRREPRPARLWADGIRDDTEGLPRIDTRNA
jgi:hypothetical protein